MTSLPRLPARWTSVAAIVAVVLLAAAYVGWTATRGSFSSTAFATRGQLDFVELTDGRNQVQQARIDDLGGPTLDAVELPAVLRRCRHGGVPKVSGVGPS